MPVLADQPGLRSIGVVVSECARDGEVKDEVRYSISSLGVTYRKGGSRLRDKDLRENVAWPNRLTLSLLYQHPGCESVAIKRRSCGWSDG